MPAGLTYKSSKGRGRMIRPPESGRSETTVSRLAALDIYAIVNSGTVDKTIISQSSVAAGNNPDGSPIPDVNPANNQATANFYVGAAISGRVFLTNSSTDPLDPNNRPVEGLTVYQLEANADDTKEYLLGKTVTDSDGHYNLAYRARWPAGTS